MNNFDFLKKLGFDDAHVMEANNIFNEEIKKTIMDNIDTVTTNIGYLRVLGISNYQEAFLRFYNMFLMEPSSFDDIFAKYDKDDLVAKLEKNIAILEHL